MTSARDRHANRKVDTAHMRASTRPDPVAFLRERQAEAEAAYACSGDRDELALVRAFERSLDDGRSR